MSAHHTLDIHPIPEYKAPLFINEPWLVDFGENFNELDNSVPQSKADNVRIYVPLDLSTDYIQSILDSIIRHFGESKEFNETAYNYAVSKLVSQIEIYEQVWFVRKGKFHTDENGLTIGHSEEEAVSLVKRFVVMLEGITDGCAETFPVEIINKLKEEYLR